MEKRKQEKTDSTKQRTNKPVRLQQERREDLREELKQRSQAAVDVASLEEKLTSRSAARYSPRQQDFRHLLRRQTDHSKITDSSTDATNEEAAMVRPSPQHQRLRGEESVPSPRHQERWRTRDKRFPEVSGGRGGDRASGSVEEERRAEGGVCHGDKRQTRAKPNIHQHHQIGGLVQSRHDPHQETHVEERDRHNYDYETQF